MTTVLATILAVFGALAVAYCVWAAIASVRVGARRLEGMAEKYGVAFGVGLGEVAGKVFRIGHLGSMTDVMALSGIATAEMCMVDLGLDIKLGSGVAAAQEYYRTNPAASQKDAA